MLIEVKYQTNLSTIFMDVLVDKKKILYDIIKKKKEVYD